MMTIGSDLRNGYSNVWTVLDCYEELCNELVQTEFLELVSKFLINTKTTLDSY
jgi:hypothetical protein